ncbi:hypothetical protein D5041_07770 [Verminephrobacter aporrectodeae subsp. tuberculatae]|uniref:hypothetical protein n=1 Tax=Verminephrobacter aporrectodeae TaxID=1110389 RepID=UPI00223875FE|nr:hypothetical protein [Verminephrobacter aporrectodeae]MCW5223497.1 hypothetical protein [Verminephrobacter aporrectodeae subsp. tuberculatae]MCW5288961.1 hypothetical protein [Verminephrobacter aporrectodeae subsp. tuberculatae]
MTPTAENLHCAQAGCNTADRPLVKCVVRVDAGEDRHTYSGLFPSTCYAVIDAMERFDDATRVRVKRVSA